MPLSSTTEQLLARAQKDATLQRVWQTAERLGAEIYLVGGAVRDLLLTGELPDDLDFTVLNHPAKNLATALAEALNAPNIPLDEDFGIYRVVLGEGKTLDLSDALDNNLTTDLARRDLTINAMAWQPGTFEVIDPHGGQADLAARTIRMVSEANMVEDPLRLLRAFRVAASIQAKAVQADTLAAVTRHKALIHQPAKERVQYEFFRLLSSENCFVQLQAMADSGLLEELFPQMSAMRAIPPSGYHHLGLFEHTLELVRQAELLIDDLPVESRLHLRAPFNGVVTRFGLVKLACILHDFGKPDTMAMKEDGSRLTFYGHEEASEAMTEEILKTWKVSNEVRTLVKKLVRWHLYPCQFGPHSSRKALLRFFRRMGEDTPDVVLLALADRLSAQGPALTQEDLDAAYQAHVWLLAQYHAEAETLSLPRLLDGREVMVLLEIPPGPRIKEVLNALQEAQQLGEVSTADEARLWVCKHCKI